jgi:hypothetical protein
MKFVKKILDRLVLLWYTIIVIQVHPLPRLIFTVFLPVLRHDSFNPEAIVFFLDLPLDK